MTEPTRPRTFGDDLWRATRLAVEQVSGAALVGTSAAFRALKHAAPSFAAADVNLLVCGERGTGKRDWAELVHRHSARRAHAFVAFDLGGLDAQTVERRLFGDGTRAGLLADARRGTLFLGSIDALAPALQEQLLRWLGSHEFGVVRVIAGTSAPLSELVRIGRFSRQLFHHVAVAQLTIAPLRERLCDVEAIAEHCAWCWSSHTGTAPIAIRDSAMRALRAYTWPGNVTELIEILATARVQSARTMITAEQIRAALGRRPHRVSPSVMRLHEVELEYIRVAVAHCNGNQSLAARRLGIGRSTLLRKLAMVEPAAVPPARRTVA